MFCPKSDCFRFGAQTSSMAICTRTDGDVIQLNCEEEKPSGSIACTRKQQSGYIEVFYQL